MLILTRSIGASIIINDEIAVKVVAVKRDRVRLGVEAPKEVAVCHQEDYDRMKEESPHSILSFDKRELE